MKPGTCRPDGNRQDLVGLEPVRRAYPHVALGLTAYSNFAIGQQRRKQPPQLETFLFRQPRGENALDFLDARTQRRQLLLSGRRQEEHVTALVDGIVRAFDETVANHARDEIGDRRTVHIEFIAELAHT